MEIEIEKRKKEARWYLVVDVDILSGSGAGREVVVSFLDVVHGGLVWRFGVSGEGQCSLCAWLLRGDNLRLK
jgi:hypothetical protein